MKKIFTILGISATMLMSAQTVLTQWNFDASSLTPSTGSGTFSMIGGVVENTQQACSCGFVGGNPSTGKSYTTKTYPDQGTNSGTAGVQFSASTASASTVSISVDVYGSGTASKYFQAQYTVDGSTWTNVTSAPSSLTATNTWATVSATLPSNAAGQANFAFRVVTVFDPANGTSYTSNAPAGNTYAPGGALRFDNVTIYNGLLAVSDVNSTKINLVKSTNVNNTILFGAKANVQIVNANGQVVKSAAVSENTTLDVSSLTKGIYIVTGDVNGQKVSQKIIKN